MLKKGPFSGKSHFKFPVGNGTRTLAPPPPTKNTNWRQFPLLLFRSDREMGGNFGCPIHSLFWAGLSLWGGGVEVVQRKLGPISRGGEFSRPFFYFFSNFRENSLISGPFLLVISRPLSPAASPRTGKPRRSCGGSLSNSWGCRTYDGLPQKMLQKNIFLYYPQDS